MAKVRTTVTVTTVDILVADTASETLKKVSTRFPMKLKETKKLERSLKSQVEEAGLTFIKIASISYEKKRYEMPVEMFVSMATEIE